MQEWYLGRQKVSLLERCPQFRGVLIEGFHCIRYANVAAYVSANVTKYENFFESLRTFTVYILYCVVLTF